MSNILPLDYLSDCFRPVSWVPYAHKGILNCISGVTPVPIREEIGREGTERQEMGNWQGTGSEKSVFLPTKVQNTPLTSSFTGLKCPVSSFISIQATNTRVQNYWKRKPDVSGITFFFTGLALDNVDCQQCLSVDNCRETQAYGKCTISQKSVRYT